MFGGVVGDTSRDMVPVRNFPGDPSPKTFKTFSPCFKKSFFYRAIHNYNILRRVIDLDSSQFRDLRRVISLFRFGVDGLFEI